MDRPRKKYPPTLATKVRRLARCGWTADRLARFFKIALTDVDAMLAPPVSWSRRLPTDWRERDDVGPDGRPLEPPAVELDGQVVAELPVVEPPPSRCEWDGPSTLTGGKRKLTDAQTLEIRRERAAGSSIYALARKYGVSRNTIYASLNAAPLHCPDAECPENGQKPRENGQ